MTAAERRGFGEQQRRRAGSRRVRAAEPRALRGQHAAAAGDHRAERLRPLHRRSAEDWLAAPRIGLAPEVFNGNQRTPGSTLMVADAVVHEMTHAALMLRGEDAGHDGEPWCQMLTDLSPAVLGREVDARPVLRRCVPNRDRDTDPGGLAVARATS